MTVFEVLRSRRAFRPGLPVQSEDIRWGYVLSGMRDEWFEEHWNRWKAGETPSFVKTTFVRVVNSAVVWTIMCGNEIYDQMSALGMTADKYVMDDGLLWHEWRIKEGCKDWARLIS